MDGSGGHHSVATTAMWQKSNLHTMYPRYPGAGQNRYNKSMASNGVLVPNASKDVLCFIGGPLRLSHGDPSGD